MGVEQPLFRGWGDVLSVLDDKGGCWEGRRWVDLACLKNLRLVLCGEHPRQMAFATSGWTYEGKFPIRPCRGRADQREGLFIRL